MQEFLEGIIADNINEVLAAAAMNFKRRINLWHAEAILRRLPNCKSLLGFYWNIHAQKSIPTF
jgi:hypothetical protein